ncbi:hypothetical protein ARMSODRAFT_296 [Armillaria solidipes]|uniref:Uncharacterized protein n=1 Tax=Armillaria solidipes TaxID=1076256 RepID=A0A2H3CLH6_9AGAR|nr:hypothetical protein ARMSODRAFT_296 [Armillaria solidipes]
MSFLCAAPIVISPSDVTKSPTCSETVDYVDGAAFVCVPHRKRHPPPPYTEYCRFHLDASNARTCTTLLDDLPLSAMCIVERSPLTLPYSLGFYSIHCTAFCMSRSGLSQISPVNPHKIKTLNIGSQLRAIIIRGTQIPRILP